jgi:hypothetical protein
VGLQGEDGSREQILKSVGFWRAGSGERKGAEENFSAETVLKRVGLWKANVEHAEFKFACGHGQNIQFRNALGTAWLLGGAGSLVRPFKIFTMISRRA